MKKLFLFVMIGSSSFILAQKMKVLSGNFDFLKGEKELKEIRIEIIKIPILKRLLSFIFQILFQFIHKLSSILFPAKLTIYFK